MRDIKEGDRLYRAVAHHWGMDIKIQYERWEVEKLTPSGMWLRECRDAGMWHQPRRTWRASTRFAAPTKGQALDSLKRRTMKRYQHNTRKLSTTKRIMAKLGLAIPREISFFDEGTTP